MHTQCYFCVLAVVVRSIRRLITSKQRPVFLIQKPACCRLLFYHLSFLYLLAEIQNVLLSVQHMNRSVFSFKCKVLLGC